MSTWKEDPLLSGDTCPDVVPGLSLGANGIAFLEGRHGSHHVFVANMDCGSIVRIPMNADGSAGTPEVFVQNTALAGADGIAFDKKRQLYVAVNGPNRLVRINSEKEIEVLATVANGLAFPASVAFGTVRSERRQLFFTNFALLGGTPSLMKIDVGVRGLSLLDERDDVDVDEDDHEDDNEDQGDDDLRQERSESGASQRPRMRRRAGAKAAPALRAWRRK